MVSATRGHDNRCNGGSLVQINKEPLFLWFVLLDSKMV